MIFKFTVGVLCLFASVAGARAQASAGGSVRGYIQDEQGAVLPGVTITAASPTVGPVYSATTDAEGVYRLLDLPPAEYTLTAELQGFSKVVRERVLVRAGLNLTVDLVLKVGNVTETVTVSVDAPMLESKAAVQTVNISGDFQRSLPLTYGNHWSNFMAITPGLAGNQLANSTSDSFSVRGAPFDSHVMQFDGADMSGSSQGTPFFVNFAREAVADIEVKMGSNDAASPLGVGLVMNVATKSGTNNLRGAVSSSFQRKGWTGNNLQGGTVAASDAFIPELGLGGPIVRDRLWFFTAYRHETVSGGIGRTPTQLASLQALAPGFEPFDNELSANQLFAKVNARLGKHQAEFFWNRGPQTRLGGSATDAGQYQRRHARGHEEFRRSCQFRLGLCADHALRRVVQQQRQHQPGRSVETQPSGVLEHAVVGWPPDGRRDDGDARQYEHRL